MTVHGADHILNMTFCWVIRGGAINRFPGVAVCAAERCCLFSAPRARRESNTRQTSGLDVQTLSAYENNLAPHESRVGDVRWTCNTSRLVEWIRSARRSRGRRSCGRRRCARDSRAWPDARLPRRLVGRPWPRAHSPAAILGRVVLVRAGCDALGARPMRRRGANPTRSWARPACRREANATAPRGVRPARPRYSTSPL